MDEVKPGYRTTEFWLSVVAALCGLALASGLFPEASVAARIIGGVLAALTTLGYTAARTKAKSGESSD